MKLKSLTVSQTKWVARKERKRSRRAKRKQCAIYGLKFGERIYYVGQTRSSLKVRLRHHLRDARKGRSSPIYKWIRSMAEAPEIILIQDGAIWNVSEIVWINRLLDAGEPLLNVSGVSPLVKDNSRPYMRATFRPKG